jgi:hypothetical protein
VSAYECGFNAFDDARMKFDVRFYLVSILFIIFDLEIAFLFPWAVAFGGDHDVAFWSMMVFLAVLTVGLRLRMEEGGARMGVIDPHRATGTRPRAGEQVPGGIKTASNRRLRGSYRMPRAAMGVATNPNTAAIARSPAQPRVAGQGVPADLDRGHHQLGAHRLAALDDLRARLLRGRDDAHLDAALRRRTLRHRAARLARASRT